MEEGGQKVCEATGSANKCKDMFRAKVLGNDEEKLIREGEERHLL